MTDLAEVIARVRRQTEHYMDTAYYDATDMRTVLDAAARAAQLEAELQRYRELLRAAEVEAPQREGTVDQLLAQYATERGEPATRPEIIDALQEATQQIADNLRMHADGRIKLVGTPQALRALIELGVRLGLAEAWGRAMKRMKFGESSAEGTVMILEGAEFRAFALELDALTPAAVLEGEQ